jgi:hypothetical protein
MDRLGGEEKSLAGRGLIPQGTSEAQRLINWRSYTWLGFLRGSVILNVRFIHTLTKEVDIMAQRKKRPTVRKGRPTTRRKARKSSMSARGRPAKRSVARAMPRKRLAKAKSKRGGAKKVARKKVRAMKPSSTPAVETVVVDVVEEPLPGVTVVTEFEATEVREGTAALEQPEESQGSKPPGSEEP